MLLSQLIRGGNITPYIYRFAPSSPARALSVTSASPGTGKRNINRSSSIMSRRHASSQPSASPNQTPSSANPTKSPSASSSPHSHSSHSHDHQGHTQTHPVPSSSSAHSHDGHDHAGHSHSLFSTHTHDHSEGAEQLITALSSGRLDRGTKITLLGLASNVGLTISKGLAGFWLNSASLLAEAGHSCSDLIADFVTLATWRISRRPATEAFPWGYSKFETLGTLSVSMILVGGGIGIGLHSYHLLLQTLLPYIETFPPSSSLHTLAHYLPNGLPSPLLDLFHSHGPSAAGHDHSHGADIAHSDSDISSVAVLNPHAAWFALASLIIKEWLYRITNKVAVAENSPVLKANALHHRADALTSGVALGAILGSSLGGLTFLDPVGGLLVSAVILQQGLSLSKVAMWEFLDAGMDKGTKDKIEGIIAEAIDGDELLGYRDIRGVKSGGQLHLDLTIEVRPDLTVRESHAIELRVRDLIRGKIRSVNDVQIHVHAQDSGDIPPSRCQ